MKTTELSCDAFNSVIEVEGEFVRYSTSDISKECLTELVSRIPLLQDFDPTLNELNETFARIELNVVIAPDQNVSASLRVMTDNISGASYFVPITNDEKDKWVAAILANVRNKEKPLMQRLLDGGYPIEDMFFHQRVGEIYIYNTLLSTQIIDKWCEDNGFDKEQRCAPCRGTITGRPMYVCKLWENEKTKNSEKSKKHTKKHKLDNYER